ncbi:MAG TPA: vWA domain-containing protein [Gaiellaceae bacterium]|nr:vWA domain-containing protein [Gaiellaceae bacterium]
MIVPSVHRGGAVELADRPRLLGALRRTGAVRVALALALAATFALLFLVARTAGAGRAAVFPEGTSTGVVVLDMSASISGPTYARVATTLQGIVTANQSVGLVMFSDTAYELLPPNSPPSALTQFVPFFVPVRYNGNTPIFGQSPWDMFTGGTRIAPGLATAARALRRAHVRHGAILLVSDLDDSAGDYPLLELEAVRLRQQHIPVRIVPLFAAPHDRRLFSALFGQSSFVDPRVFTHTATRHTQAIAAPAPWALIALGLLLVALLAANERWNARLEVAA